MNPEKPLRPTYANERVRIEEHDKLMAEAAAVFCVPLPEICPDCYRAAPACIHRPDEPDSPLSSDPQFGVDPS